MASREAMLLPHVGNQLDQEANAEEVILEFLEVSLTSATQSLVTCSLCSTDKQLEQQRYLSSNSPPPVLKSTISEEDPDES
eukprot:1395261-Amphidinium_carterae.1